jgi:hypothetical protein
MVAVAAVLDAFPMRGVPEERALFVSYGALVALSLVLLVSERKSYVH